MPEITDDNAMDITGAMYEILAEQFDGVIPFETDPKLQCRDLMDCPNPGCPPEPCELKKGHGRLHFDGKGEHLWCVEGYEYEPRRGLQ